MTRTSHIPRALPVLLAALFAVSTGCAGSSGASSSSRVHSTSTTAKQPVGPCHGDRPILYLEGTTCADGTLVDSPKTPGAGNTWSPSGDTDAFVSANARRLILRDSDGNEQTLYRAPKHTNLVHRPAWSPDGSRIALLLMDTRGVRMGLILPGQALPSYKTRVLVIDARTGAVRRSAKLPNTVVHMPYLMNPPDTLAFSPDGSNVLVSWESPAVVDVSTGRVRRIWPAPAVANWTADGDVMFLDVVQRKRFGALREWSPATGQRVIWSSAQLRSRGISAEHGIEYGQLRMSPDGSRVAIRTTTPQGTAIELVDASGAKLGQTLGRYPTDGRIWDFDWSPDATRIAAIVIAGNTAEVRVLDPEKQAWSTVATLPITIDGWDTLEAMAPIKKLSWNS